MTFHASRHACPAHNVTAQSQCFSRICDVMGSCIGGDFRLRQLADGYNPRLRQFTHGFNRFRHRGLAVGACSPPITDSLSNDCSAPCRRLARRF